MANDGLTLSPDELLDAFYTVDILRLIKVFKVLGKFFTFNKNLSPVLDPLSRFHFNKIFAIRDFMIRQRINKFC